MFRYKLRTLLIVLALGPPVLAGGWWKYSAWRQEQAQRKLLEDLKTQPWVFEDGYLFDPGGPPSPLIEDWRERP
jgi:hypothetical protein